MHYTQKTTVRKILNQSALLQYDRPTLLRLLGGHVGEFLELLGAHLAEVSEQEDEGELDALFSHHQEALDEQAFHDLGTDALEKTKGTFMLNDVVHHLDEAAEALSVSCWRWVGLQTDFCDDERLCCNCGKGL